VSSSEVTDHDHGRAQVVGCTMESNLGPGVLVRSSPSPVEVPLTDGKRFPFSLRLHTNAAVSQVHSIHIEDNQIRGNCTEPAGEGAQVAITTDAHDITLRGNTIARGGDGAAGVGVRCGPETRRIELLENDFGADLAEEVVAENGASLGPAEDGPGTIGYEAGRPAESSLFRHLPLEAARL